MVTYLNLGNLTQKKTTQKTGVPCYSETGPILLLNLTFLVSFVKAGPVLSVLHNEEAIAFGVVFAFTQEYFSHI